VSLYGHRIHQALHFNQLQFNCIITENFTNYERVNYKYDYMYNCSCEIKLSITIIACSM